MLFSGIEAKLRTKEMATVEDYLEVFQSAAINQSPYVVKRLYHTDFKNWAAVADSYFKKTRLVGFAKTKRFLLEKLKGKESICRIKWYLIFMVLRILVYLKTNAF